MSYTGSSKDDVINQVNDQKMCLEDLILRVKDKVSQSCNIPVKLPDSSLLSIISETKKWFYDHYEYSVEEGYLYVNHKAFTEDPDYLKYGYLTLPDDIFSVYGIRKIDNRAFKLREEYLNTSNSYVSFGIQSSYEDLVGFVIAEKYDAMRAATLYNKHMRYDFNRLTRRFRVMGEVPSVDIVLDVYKKIPDCALFEDPYFFKYVVAEVQKNIAYILGIFQYQLPGNIQINYDLIQAMGQESIDKIEEEIKTSEGVDWFMTE